MSSSDRFVAIGLALVFSAYFYLTPIIPLAGAKSQLSGRSRECGCCRTLRSR